MMNVQWVQGVAVILSAMVGAICGIFTAGWRLGRIEARLKLEFKTALSEAEKRIEDQVRQSTGLFDETLRGIRQKINDVELSTERRFVPRDEFAEFRDEYRQDMRDLKALIAQAGKSKVS